jgi:TonB family protein
MGFVDVGDGRNLSSSLLMVYENLEDITHSPPPSEQIAANELNILDAIQTPDLTTTDNAQEVSSSNKPVVAQKYDAAHAIAKKNDLTSKRSITSESSHGKRSSSDSLIAKSFTQSARPDHAYNPKPHYPIELRERGVSGVVWLRVWVDSAGRPREIEVAKGSGYRLFDDSALRAVQHWRFIPAKYKEQNLASWVEFAVRFVING